MKRFLPLIISLIFLLAMLLSGCSEVNRINELKEVLSTTEDSLSDVFTEDTCQYGEFTEYIINWAKSSNEVSVPFKGKSSTVLFNSATKGCNKEPSTVILCNVNTEKIHSSFKVISTAVACLLGPERHGDIKLIITESQSNKLVGINEVPNKYFKGDNLINLQPSSNDVILTSGPNHASCYFNKSGKMTTTKYSNAFEISMNMSDSADPYNFSSDHSYPNPVNTVGTLLATFKCSGKLFDIASFTCESREGYMPQSVSAVIVLDDNCVESFKEKFEKSYSNIEKKFEKLEDTFTYTLTEVDCPPKVINEELCNNLISLMYTLNTGACIQDEDTGIINAGSYISAINTENGDLGIEIDIRTRGESYLDNLSSEYETTAGLCETEYSIKKHGRTWHSDTKSAMDKYFIEKVPLQSNKISSISIKKTENDKIAENNPGLNMIIYSFDKGNRKIVLSNIIDFIDPDTVKK